MGAIIGAVTRLFVMSGVAKFIAWKTIISFLVITAFGLLAYNVVTEIMEELLAFVIDQVESATAGVGWEGMALEFTGLTAWLAEKLLVPEQVGVMISFVYLKWVVCKIPFIKW